MESIKWLHEPQWMSKVKVIQWSWLKVSLIEYNCFSLETAGSIEVIFHVEPAQNRPVKLWKKWYRSLGQDGRNTHIW